MTSISRRRFLQAAVAASAVGAAVPRWMMPAGAQPLGSNEGMLVVLDLGGGCDALSVLVPSDGTRRSDYVTARGSEALAAPTLLPATVDHGFNPAMPNLAQRFGAGDVAMIDGVGMPVSLRSHAVSTMSVQSALLTPGPTGWLGRHLDGYEDRNDELMSVAVAPTVPLHIRGARNQAAAMPAGAGMWGADDTLRFEQTAANTLREFADTSAGVGPWKDLITSAGDVALAKASLTTGLSTSSSAPSGVRKDMEIAAHILNADIGTRVVSVVAGGFDTHAGQNSTLTQRLGGVDAAIEGFFSTLAPGLRNRVLVLVVSEFGRKAELTASLGTDHGWAGLSMLIGSNVAGGLHADSPSIVDVDAQGSLKPTADLRSLYASIIDGWLGGDSNEALGGTFDPLDVIAAPPGSD